jgi:hypothetical protein
MSMPVLAQDIGESQAIFARKLLEKACYFTYAAPEQIEKWAESSALLEVPPEFLKKAFDMPPKKAWSVKNDFGDYVVAYSSDGVCSIFVGQANATALKEQFNKTLPAPETGMKVVKQIDMTTTASDGETSILGYEITGPTTSVKIFALLQTNTSKKAGFQGRMDVRFFRTMECTISKSAGDGKTSVFVKEPGQNGIEVAKSPHSISQCAISSDGSFIAYVTKERGQPDLIIQKLTSGMRLTWTQIKDMSGKLAFGPDVLTYTSDSDAVTVRLEDVAARFK